MIASKSMRMVLMSACLLVAVICLSSLSAQVARAEAAGDVVAKGLVDSECCKDVKIPFLRHRDDAETACFKCCMDNGHKMWYTTLKACHCSDQAPGIHAKLKAAPPPESDEDSLDEEDEVVNKRIKLIRESREPEKERFTGGIVVSLETGTSAHSTSASLSAAEKKGLKEVEELERELDLKNTFSRETNRRDEDAEMNKYIEEQIQLRREAAKRERDARKGNAGGIQDKTKLTDDEIFALPVTIAAAASENVDDILLQTLSKNYSSTIDEKSESMLSSQMLNGIPEVDLGLGERIRTVEATEEAKLRLASGSSKDRWLASKKSSASTVPTNYSCNFQSHRGSRDRSSGELRTSHHDHERGSNHNHHHQQHNQKADTIVEPVVSVGEAPREIELRVPSSSGGDRKPPARGRASDDYYLQKFKKNTRR